MKRRGLSVHLAYIGLVLALVHPARAQTWTLTSGPWILTSSQSFYGGGVASSADGLKMAAVQLTTSLVFVSTNAGTSWRQVPAPRQPWTAIASSANGSNLVAVSLYGGIWVSHNAGSSWFLGSSTSLGWISVACSSDGSVAVASPYEGVLLVSTNTGTTWRPVAGPSYWGPVTCSADGSLLAAVRDGATVISRDVGSTWNPATNAPLDATALAASANGSLLTAGTGSGIYLSYDSGTNWVPATNAPALAWEAIASSADGSSITAVANGGSIYSSADFGVSWHSNSAPSAQWSCLAASTDANVQVAGGNLGLYVYPGYDLGIAQAASPLIATNNGDITFTIYVTNFGPRNASGIVVTDTLPSSVTFVSSVPSSTNVGGTLAFTIASLTNGAVAAITAHVKAKTLGEA